MNGRMNIPLRRSLTIYQWLAGLSDTVTGLLLLLFPEYTFSLMGLRPGYDRALVRFIGVFVFSLGLTYLWTVVRMPLNELAVPAWLTQWKITALIRGMVAVFLVWQLAAQTMEPRWLSVCVFDGVVAGFQFIGIDRGWIQSAA